MHFSLRWLFIAILFIALCIVTLLNANRTWSAITHSALIISLSLAIVGGIFSTGSRRAFAAGAAIVGSIYFGAVILYPAWNLGDVIAKLVYDIISAEETVVLETDPNGSSVQVMTRFRPPENEFYWILQCMLTGIVSVLGGIVGVWFWANSSPSVTNQI
jgi:hypothetical protein